MADLFLCDGLKLVVVNHYTKWCRLNPSEGKMSSDLCGDIHHLQQNKHGEQNKSGMP